jgi:hypothetical protein
MLRHYYQRGKFTYSIPYLRIILVRPNSQRCTVVAIYGECKVNESVSPVLLQHNTRTPEYPLKINLEPSLAFTLPQFDPLFN